MGERSTKINERNLSVDFLRGIAIFGILFVNIYFFGFPDIFRLNPSFWSTQEQYVWLFIHIFFDGKFFTIFTLLFGISTLYFFSSKSENASKLYKRRSITLIFFGMLHAYLLWSGDILFLYGVSAFFVYHFRNLSVRTLLVIGAILYSIRPLIQLLFLGIGYTVELWQPGQAEIINEIEAYRGSWIEQTEYRAERSVISQVPSLFTSTFWFATGTMIFGMVLYKTGYGRNKWSKQAYVKTGSISLLIGFTIILAGIGIMMQANWSHEYGRLWRMMNYYGSLFVAIGYIAIIMLISKKVNHSNWLYNAISKVGRTAFSNYIYQTIIATTIFFGHGLGLFAALSLFEAYIIVFLIIASQLILTTVWLKYFTHGPLEWVWRKMIYFRT